MAHLMEDVIIVKDMFALWYNLKNNKIANRKVILQEVLEYKKLIRNQVGDLEYTFLTIIFINNLSRKEQADVIKLYAIKIVYLY